MKPNVRLGHYTAGMQLFEKLTEARPNTFKKINRRLKKQQG
jgi:hypothetical protein